MNWTVLITLFGLSTVKFLFTPFGGPKLGLSFWETYISCTAGAVLSSAVFYYSASYFLKRAQAKKKLLYEQALEKGIELKRKRKFTRMNKFVVRIKRTLGIYGTSLWVPLFLSVPLGTIITAKFYGKRAVTFPLILLGMGMNGLITTGLAYLVFS